MWQQLQVVAFNKPEEHTTLLVRRKKYNYYINCLRNDNLIPMGGGEV